MTRASATGILSASVADWRLADHAKAGDEDAFASLFHAHHQRVYRIARSIVGTHDRALDAVQETFLKVHQGLAGWRGEASLRTWITRIAIRCAVDMRRRSSRSRETETHAPEPAHDPRPELEKSMLVARLRQLTERLEGQDCLILRLRLFGGLSNKEIAQHLGLSEANTRVQLSNAVRRLKDML